MHQAYLTEESPAAKDAIRQILINSRLAAEGRRPICQDTGMAVVFVECGMQVDWADTFSIEEAINEGVRKAYTHLDNPLRASVISDPIGERLNTRDNTPAVIHFNLAPGNKISFRVAAKGFGSENKAKLGMLNPSDNIVDWVVEQIPSMGAGWCPPGMLGIGVGGTAEKTCLMAKESLLDPIDMTALMKRGAQNAREEMRIAIYERVNALGIGTQGLGGMTTVLDVKIKDYPTHAAAKPIAIIPNCVATRHVEFSLIDEAIAEFVPPSLDDWPIIEGEPNRARRVHLQTVSKQDIAEWKTGETILLNGSILTGRDAAHKRLCDLIRQEKNLPVDLTNKFLYYCGPVPKVGDEVIGPAGPTTATRMDPFTEMILAHTGLIGMIGKGERSRDTCDTIAQHQSIYLIAVGGAAYHVAQSIKQSRIVAFEDLGMEAIHEFEVVDFPVTVAVDSAGNSIHEQGPKQWSRT